MKKNRAKVSRKQQPEIGSPDGVKEMRANMKGDKFLSHHTKMQGVVLKKLFRLIDQCNELQDLVSTQMNKFTSAINSRKGK